VDDRTEVRHQRGPRPRGDPDRHRRWQLGDEPPAAAADEPARNVELVTSRAAALWISRDTHTYLAEDVGPEEPPAEPPTMQMARL
jgi:hypothetical protein